MAKQRYVVRLMAEVEAPDLDTLLELLASLEVDSEASIVIGGASLVGEDASGPYNCKAYSLLPGYASIEDHGFWPDTMPAINGGAKLVPKLEGVKHGA